MNTHTIEQDDGEVTISIQLTPSEAETLEALAQNCPDVVATGCKADYASLCLMFAMNHAFHFSQNPITGRIEVGVGIGIPLDPIN